MYHPMQRRLRRRRRRTRRREREIKEEEKECKLFFSNEGERIFVSNVSSNVNKITKKKKKKER